MRNDIKMLNSFRNGMGVVVLIAGITLQASSYDGQESPSCRSNSQASHPAQMSSANPIAGPSRTSDSAVADVTRGPSGDKATSPKPHGVRLSWDASIPATKSPSDEIKGYNVYRRSSGKEYDKLNTYLIQGTSCVDDQVTAGHTYYYETKAVSANGAISKPSQEVKATISSR
jgi:hypothetical protein